MPTYLSPGVYVEEVASGSAPIAGVGTSTAGFIGIIPTVQLVEGEKITGVAGTAPYDLAVPTEATSGTVVKVTVDGVNKTTDASIAKNSGNGKLELTLKNASAGGEKIVVDYTYVPPPSLNQYSWTLPVTGEKITVVAGTNQTYDLAAPAGATSGTVVKVTKDKDNTPISGATIAKSGANLQLTLPSSVTAGDSVTVDYTYTFSSVDKLSVILCTNFAEFKKSFGDFPTDTEEAKLSGRRALTHAVYGFFNNGGTRCYVVWANTGEIDQALQKFAAIDEIAIVAAPGITTKPEQTAIADHCTQMGDRVAVLDSPETVEDGSNKLDLTKFDPKGSSPVQPGNSKYAAYYFPWIQVSDPASKSLIYVPPSGHIAGIYARVDAQRGVYKAPANETVFGAVGLKYGISKPKQDGLNPQGINCIRALNGNIQVWGARTLGGDDNGEFKYISTRRLFNYLRESIDEGTQWAVFEPNSPELWAKIRRSVTAFLTMVWRTGALFGTTPEQAFFVKCDEETNPPELREQGQVVTIIGVAVVKPAEFVIFRISQWAGPGGN